MKIATAGELPISFDVTMIPRILDGRKTTTRRVIRNVEWPSNGGHPLNVGSGIRCEEVDGKLTAGMFSPAIGGLMREWDHVKSRVGNVGQRLWVRETFYYDLLPWSEGGSLSEAPQNLDHVYYRADGECCEQIPECACAEVGKVRWRPGRVMPRWAARLFLEVTGIRVEKLHEITDAGVRREGFHRDVSPPHDGGRLTAAGRREVFAEVWDKLHGYDDLIAWDNNPWVFVIDFKRVDK